MININEQIGMINARRHMNYIGVALILIILLQWTVSLTVYSFVAISHGAHIVFYGVTPAEILKTVAEIKASVSGNLSAPAVAILLTVLVGDLVPFVICARAVDIDTRHFFSCPKISGGMMAILGIIALGGSLLISMFVNIIRVMLKTVGILLATPSFSIPWKSPVGAAAMIIAVAVAAPFAEEFVFRGVLLTVFRRFGNVFAIVASSLVWALLHGNLVQGLPVFVMGLFFGIVAVKSDSIIPTLILHSLNNTLSLIGNSAISQKSVILLIVIAAINFSLIIVAIVLASVFNKSIFNVQHGEKGPGFKVLFTCVPMIITILICVAATVRSIQPV